jgi:Ulp1 family protease
MESVKRFLLDEWWETRGTESDIQWKIGYKQSKMVPQQHNGVDCGVFVCMYAEYLSRGVNVFDFKQEDMNALRLQIALSIMGNDYFNRFFGDISTLN